jgi:redox-sensitive bicupin YhaK (pirin superfamily)
MGKSPRASQNDAPTLSGITAAQIPVVKTPEGALVHVISGEVQGIQGPVKEIVIEPEYFDVELPAGKFFTHLVKPDHTVFAYVIEGEAYFDQSRTPFSHDTAGINYFDFKPPCACGDGTLVLYEKGGDYVTISTEKKAARFLLISGKPLNEPVAWYGPIVMNTQAELRTAFQEYQDGTFVKER